MFLHHSAADGLHGKGVGGFHYSMVYGLTGRVLGGRSVAPGAGLSRQNLGTKYIPCVGTIMNNNGCQIYFILLPNLLV